MRPVRKGKSPRAGDFKDYKKAKPHLVQRIGPYCSYCERYVTNSLAVEHILPQDHRPELEGCWDNFILSCTNCNSHKGSENISTTDYLFPDRDNTFAALEYQEDGSVVASKYAVKTGAKSIADKTIELTGQNKASKDDKTCATSRKILRMNKWLVIKDWKQTIDQNPSIQAMRERAIDTAREVGHFSIWMKIFATDTDMRNRLIDAFPGTRESGCFDNEGQVVSPAPNPDQLENGSKI